MKLITGLVLLISSLATLPVAAQTEDTQDNSEALARLTAIVEAWRASPHADQSAEAFIHWNDEAEGIPGSCAVCHSSSGFTEFVSGPMMIAGVLDHPVPTGGLVDCVVCHSAPSTQMSTVQFPSGVSVGVETFGTAASCAVCHQGRASANTVAAVTMGVDDDTVSDALTFINIHYAPSAATLMGSVTRGGYQYEGKDYKGRFAHVPESTTCVDCHSPHSLKPVPVASCATCHKGIDAFDQIRTSKVDYDGDGDVTEGIANPIATLHGQLYGAIQRYAAEIAGTPIIHADGYPYFFADSNANGTVDEGEAAFPNRYVAWTPRLLRAAYNYQFIAKDKAAYTHNPHYALQLLYDSLENLSGSVDVDMADLVRP